MAFIKAQKVIRDEHGKVTSGSAAIVDTVYVSNGLKITVNRSFAKNLERSST